MIDFNFDKQCYGCRACENICVRKAITMKYNSEGFLIPVVDKDKCIECKLCEKICPKLTAVDIPKKCDSDKIVSAYRKDSSRYREYTSSGIFNELAKRTIANGGKVCGCIWNENMQAEHILTDNIEDVKKMSYSKYVQSDMKECYREIEQTLKDGYHVLFSGTPCQVAAMKKYLRKDYSGLFTIAIVCHGVPSPKVWEAYKTKLENEQNAKMVNANFRYKGKYGWITPFSYYEFDDGKKLEKLSFTEDPYVIAFGADILHRNTCYNCNYKGSLNEADLIIGDFWGCSSKLLSASKNKGISSVIIHTQKGQEMIDSLSDVFVLDTSTSDFIKAENKPIYAPVKYNPVREKFYNDFKQDGSLKFIYTMFNRKKYKVKRVLYKFSIFELLKRMKYKIKH
ncbi:MAG: Coenzyme F420 hydrogenase/dehydrogenase, beta subunit C-terminal domain [Ruminococcus sp.]|nr:Coenzyme F420 hydrogenase/dehydrogenase, beta subunit C-terminal domain [Ruminococcus sp.]